MQCQENEDCFSSLSFRCLIYVSYTPRLWETCLWIPQSREMNTASSFNTCMTNNLLWEVRLLVPLCSMQISVCVSVDYIVLPSWAPPGRRHTLSVNPDGIRCEIHTKPCQDQKASAHVWSRTSGILVASLVQGELLGKDMMIWKR